MNDEETRIYRVVFTACLVTVSSFRYKRSAKYVCFGWGSMNLPKIEEPPSKFKHRNGNMMHVPYSSCAVPYDRSIASSKANSPRSAI
jgi:hypothetical protein